MRCFRYGILSCLWLAIASSAFLAEGEPASIRNTRKGDALVPVALGQSVVALTGPWRFHVGDNPQWADATFDDSQWETVDLTPTAETNVPGVPIPGFVTGWEGRGHPRYAGYAWYRMNVHISGVSGPLTLLAPEWFDSAFQVFANGRLVGSFGEFKGPIPTLFEGNPTRFTLPASDYARDPDGSTLIAFRFYMAAASLGSGVRGGMHGPPRIGLPAAADAIFHMEWEREYRRLASAVAAALLYILFAILIAMIFAFSRSDKILLWPLSASLLSVVLFSLIFSTNVQWMSEVRFEALIDLAGLVAGYLWLLTWWAYFGLQHKRWLFNTILALGAWNLATLEFFTIALRIGRASPALLLADRISGLCNGSAVFLVMAAIAWLGWKRAERRQRALFLALAFQLGPVIGFMMSLLHLRTAWQPFGVVVTLNLISSCASLICFSIVLFGQFRSSLQRQQAMLDDVKQAREVQQLLIPEQLPRLAGWTIESEYRPAREVGGDFFQIIPNRSDGSLLIVAGDVSGKGLQAGMLVAMLVGAIRTESARSSDPVEILNTLNARLHEREQAQATCLALRIEADGSATLANAGHLAPYMNGYPLEMEGALPLGMIETSDFPVLHFNLRQSDRMVMMSDGVVEARNAEGELLGFARMAALTRKAAAEIADAAQRWGQEDDITVLTFVRLTPQTA